MSDASIRSQETRQGLPPWAKKTLVVVVTLAVLVIAYFVLAAFVPRWWAQRIAGLAEGGFARGILWGLSFGLLCTAIPLILFACIWQGRRWKHHRVLQILLAVAALVIALPNLMTLSIVLGGSNAAHAGERILDVDAPGFRGASLVGAIVGALACVIFFVAVNRYRKRGRDLNRVRENLERQRLEEKREEERRRAAQELGTGPDDVPPGAHRSGS